MKVKYSVLIFVILFLAWANVYYYFKSAPPIILNPADSIVCTLEHNMLSAIINAEAGPNTKDTTDAYLVGSTVLNRADHTDFPDVVADVIRERGQYDGFRSSNYYRTEQSDSIAVRLMLGYGRDCGVLFFCRHNVDIKLLNKYRIVRWSESHKFYGT